LASIHRYLDAIGLDWNASNPGAATLATRATIANPAIVSLASARFVGPAFASVALVVFCAGFVLRRQRQLFGSYLQIDDLMEQRNRELKVAQTELMHSQKMKALGTLAAGIAHEFNTLLSVIRMSNKLICRKVKGNPEVDENVAEVEKAVEQGKHIVGSMLGFSNDRQADGQAGLFLPDLVEDTVGLLSRQFLSGITLDLELEPTRRLAERASVKDRMRHRSLRIVRVADFARQVYAAADITPSAPLSSPCRMPPWRS
jgi:signal transduction histidine kinase